MTVNMASEETSKPILLSAQTKRQQENIDIDSMFTRSAANNNRSMSNTNLCDDGKNNTTTALEDLSNNFIAQSSFEHNFSSQSGVLVEAHDSNDECAYSHISDEELTGDPEISNLRGARNRPWGTEIDPRLETAAFAQVDELKVPKPVTAIMGNNKSALHNTSASAAAAAQAAKATHVARKMARRVIGSTNLGNTDMLARLINGSTRAPGQLFSWVSSGFSSPGTDSDTTNNMSYFDMNDPSLFQPTVRGMSFSTIPTLPTPRSSLPPSLYNTPPTSYGGSPNASSTNVASTADGTMNSTDYRVMSAGTLFERGPTGDVVLTSPVDAGEDLEEAEDENFEVIFAMDEEATPAQTQAEDVMDDTFCVIGPASSTTI